jgi:hypothetical protein
MAPLSAWGAMENLILRRDFNEGASIVEPSGCWQRRFGIPVCNWKPLARRARAGAFGVKPMEHIAAAGNTEVPAFLALLKEGCRVDRELVPEFGERWIAEKGDLRVSAESPLQVLGLYWMRRQRGPSWQAEDAEVEAFLKHFYPKGRS